VAIITKIIKTNAEKAFARKGFYRKLVQRNDVSLKKGIALTKFVIIGFLLFFTGWASAQTADDSNSVDVSMIRESKQIIGQCQFYIDSSDRETPASVVNKAWQPLRIIGSNKYIPKILITKPVFLKFALQNNSDTAVKMFFIAGVNIKSMHIYKQQGGGQLSQLKDESKSDGYQPVILNGKERQELIVKIKFTKKDYNFFNPLIIKDSFLPKHKNLRYYKNDAQPTVGFLLSGILLMMVFFSGSNYLVSNKKEFLYNCCYPSACLDLYF
jgi:hypothetical protein